jgi:uncharacterized protein
MVQVTYPGVYVVEVPSGVHTIAGVSTSVAAFVDRFSRGPDNRAVQIFGLTDFAREFGGLASYSPGSYAIQQFFLNGGTEAWVTRVGRSATPNLYDFARVMLTGGATGTDNIVRVFAGRQVGGVSVNNPGSWGNSLRVEVDYDTVTLPNTNLDPGGILLQDELFNLTISQVEVRDGRTFVVAGETFPNLTMRPGVPNNALAVVNEGSRLVQLDRVGAAALPVPFVATFRPTATGTVSDLPAATPPVLPTPTQTLRLQIDPDGPTGVAPPFAVTATLNHPAAPAGADFSYMRPFVEAAIRAADPNNPLLAGATVQFVRGRLRVQLGRGGVGFNPNATVTVLTDPLTTADLQLTVTQGAVVGPQMVPLAGGGDGVAVTDAELRGVQASKTGIYALEDVSIFNILCLPIAADLAETQMRNTYAEATAYCEERRAFIIIDIPETTDTLEDMQAWLTANDTLRHRNAAVYFPRVRIADPLNGSRLRSVAASGTLAGVYARTDGTRGVWKAPAGIEAQLRGVQELAAKLTDRENGALNPLAANVLRSFPVYGIVSWGARTLEGADQRGSEWKYIPIRRLALFLEESLFRGTKWVVFEPNDEPLWAQIRMNLRAFMMGMFRQGAFQGSTPDQAFFVKCDGETTTQADRNLGIVNIEVGFAPLKPAEFVIIRIQQIAGDLG